MLKNITRRMAQRVLGFSRYLFVFAIFNINRIKIFRSEKGFRFFMGLIPAEGSILDIGANIGINTVILAQKFPRAVVHAFEPVAENYAALEKVVTYYKLTNVHLHNTALGDQAGRAAMVMPEYKGSKMQGWSRMKENENTGGETFMVPIARLDDFHLQNITALKIDVENFEYFVLKGGSEMIRNNKPIVFCELWNDDRKQKCFELMKGLGYEIKILRGDELVLYVGEDVLDYFFIPV